MRSLTAEQEQAVARRSEPLLLSAAAGSGKTSVLVERFVRAVREDGIPPGKILAITFTERAAGELRARVRARLLELGERDAARDTEAAFVGTFHGFCARLLRAHPLAAGLDPEFAIIDEGLAARLRGRAFAAALEGFLAGGDSAAVDLLAAYSVDRVRAMVEQVYDELRSRGQRLPRLPVPTLGGAAPDAEPSGLDLDAAAACARLDELLRRFGDAYEQLKRARAGADFDDLELLTRELLLERERVRETWAQRFELLMVDEFQDTNPRQLDILAALDRRNLFTVGDELQSIYGFRHADVSLFRARRVELGERGGTLSLTRNFRSHAALLDVVNAAFAERFASYTPLIAGRIDAQADGGEQVELLLTSVNGWEEREELAEAIAAGLPRAQLWRQAEARLLAQRVAELVHDGHARAGDVVVLLRAAADLEVFERALQQRGLRTLAAVGAFWEHEQVIDLLSYLRAIANPLDELALYSALASPLGGCSRDCLALLAQAARDRDSGVWQTALDATAEGDRALQLGLAPGDRAALGEFCAWLAAERATAARRTIGELIERAVQGRGYREHVLGLDAGERRLANVHKLLRLARRFEASEGRDLRAFLDHVAHLRDAVKVEPDAPVEGVDADAVRLMTIHAAKGLEFPVVCLADLGRQPNTQTPDLLVDGERLGLRLVRLDGAASSPALDYEQLCRERREREAQEEDRIMYVAMTRARERLLLSGSLDFQGRTQARAAAPVISWLGPALVADLPRLLQAGVAVHDLPLGAGSSTSVRCRLSSPLNVGSVLRLDDHREAEVGQVGERSSSTGQVGEQLFEEAGERLSSQAAGERLSSQEAGGQLSIFAEGAPSSIRAAPGVPELATPPLPEPETPGVPELTTLSYTSVSELERCGYRFYLERALGFSEDRSAARADPAHAGLEARARGTLVHRLMESLEPVRPSAPSPERVAQLARELGLRVDGREAGEIAGLIERAGAAALMGRLAGARSLRREHPFAFSLAGIPPAGERSLVNGVIDLLADEGDGAFAVIDYKSDRVAPGVDLDALVEREYGIQRVLYALAVLRGGAASVEIVHWFLERPHEWVTVRYQAAERASLEERLAVRVARARARGYTVSPNPHRGLCLACPGRTGLCSWGEEETLREHAAGDPVAAELAG